MGTMRLDATCPACHNVGMLYNTATTDVPYFGECMETHLRCEACGFKHNDLVILQQNAPTRFSFEVKEEADLFARVVRGNSGTIRIPELGVLIEPGPMAESFVSNVEGVLTRVLTVVGQMKRAGDAEQAANAEAMEERIARILDGKETITLILEDPFGNSAIAHPEAEKETLSEDEASHLKTGMTVIDLEDLRDASEDKGDDDGVPDVDDLLRP